MNSTADKTDSTIINVIEDFDYSTQNTSYNEKFRKWRKDKEVPYSFGFEKNRKETVFIDGRGFIDNTASDAEKKVLSEIFYIIGIAILIWITIADVLGNVIVQILGIIGLNIHTSFMNPVIYGGSTEIVAVLITISLMKTLFPLIYMHKKLKLPLKVEFMQTMNHPSGLVTAIALTLTVCTIINIPSAYSDDVKEIYTYFKSINTDVEVWGQKEFIIYTVFDTIILSSISEMFFRGAMFAVLRQFGDAFAILITSITALLLTQDITEWIPVFLISLISSFGMLHSGSIFTAIAVNILFKMYQLALTIIEVDTSLNMPVTRSMFMMIMFLTGATVLLIEWFRIRKKNVRILAEYKSELSEFKRVTYSIKTYPYSVVALICFFYTIISFIVK